MINNFKKPDLKASRYREKRLGILNEETIKEISNFIENLEFLKESYELHKEVVKTLRLNGGRDLPRILDIDEESGVDIVSVLVNTISMLRDFHKDFSSYWLQMYLDYREMEESDPRNVFFNTDYNSEAYKLRHKVDNFLGLG